MTDPIHAKITEIVQSDKVVLFMKGSRHFPQCGFSATVVGILDKLLPSYKTVNVLSDPAIRDGIKSFSSWPTIPQLYVGGQFVGGCDIIRDMFEAGELQALLGADAPAAAKEPSVTLSDAAVAAFRGAVESADDALRIEIGPNFEYDLTVDAKKAGDVVTASGGLTIVIDPASARRADGMKIDFVSDGSGGGGFKIDNPNEPPRVRSLSATDVKAMRDRGDAFELIDVRTDAERRTASIAGARWLDDAGAEHVLGLPKDTPLVFHCHHGTRSRAAAERFLSQGFTRVYNLEGGIEAWSTSVDPSVPRY